MIAACPAPSDEPAITVSDHFGSPLVSRNWAQPSSGWFAARYWSSLLSRFSMLFARFTLTIGDVSTPLRSSIRILIAHSGDVESGTSLGPQPVGGGNAIGASLRYASRMVW